MPDLDHRAAAQVVLGWIQECAEGILSGSIHRNTGTPIARLAQAAMTVLKFDATIQYGIGSPAAAKVNHLGPDEDLRSINDIRARILGLPPVDIRGRVMVDLPSEE